jgi:hypothetical protein
VTIRAARFIPWRSLALPALCILILGAALGLALLLASLVSDDGIPPKAPAFVTPEPSTMTVVDVKQRRGNDLVVIRQVGTDSVEEPLALTAETRIERLRPAVVADVEVGDWLTIVGVPNEVRNFAIHAVIVFKTETTAVDGLPRSPLGFFGHETARNPNDRPLVGGPISAISAEDSSVTVDFPSGPAEVLLLPEGRLFVLEAGGEEDIGDGTRIATDPAAGPGLALLVRPPNTD